MSAIGTRGINRSCVARRDCRRLDARKVATARGVLVTRCLLPRIRFHDLRHSHATHLLAANVHPKIASERLGHSRVGLTLDTYSHVLPGMQEAAVARIDDVFGAALNKRA
jgi:integrase